MREPSPLGEPERAGRKTCLEVYHFRETADGAKSVFRLRIPWEPRASPNCPQLHRDLAPGQVYKADNPAKLRTIGMFCTQIFNLFLQAISCVLNYLQFRK